MNITITIPDKHVPELLAVIASMLAETQVEASQDPTPDHPELGLEETRTEIAYDDLTMQDLPWDSSWPEPPPLPEGKTRWMNRGTFKRKYFSADGRYVFYLKSEGWKKTVLFSGEFHHIEAV